MRIATKMALMATAIGGFALLPVGALSRRAKPENQSQESIDLAIQSAIAKRQRKEEKRRQLAEKAASKQNNTEE
jgi:hypothetical protein